MIQKCRLLESGKGAVQLTGSAFALAGAGTVGWADKHLQAEFLERAKSNFYGNDVSRALGKTLVGDYYNEGYSMLKVDEDRNIQNVGREMAKLGKPTLGAVLQGGVNFSNGVATSLIVAPAMGSVTGALGQTGHGVGTTVNVLNKGYTGYKAGRGIYDTGAAGVEFVQAHRAFDENDPASKQRYYAAVTDITSKALQSPRTVGRAFKMAASVKEMRVALGGKDAPSKVLGPDGKPYQKPPEELSDFRKFMLGKNEPGMLTRVMTASINLPANPVSGAVTSAEKWANSRVDRLLGKGEPPKPLLIVPGQPQPNPDARIIIPGQPVPKPDAKIITSGISSAPPAKDVKIWLPGQAVPKPDARIIIPGQPVPNPDAKLILPGD